MSIKNILNLEKYPIHQLDSVVGQALFEDCRREYKNSGMFTLSGFVRPAALEQSVTKVSPLFEKDAFTHERRHNIYFDDDFDQLAKDHPALGRFTTKNHTICADQIFESVIMKIYHWLPLMNFLAAVLEKPRLYTMDDPIACVNVMGYNHGESLNWHFDRAEFSTTLMLQEPEAGGVFEYRRNLRSENNPNFEGVAQLVNGKDCQVQQRHIKAGSLSLFAGKNTAHRITPIIGKRARIIAVFTYYESSGVSFSDTERLGFYGRTLEK